MAFDSSARSIQHELSGTKLVQCRSHHEDDRIPVKTDQVTEGVSQGNSPQDALSARSFVKSLMDQWKGIGHLIDFMLDGGKASLGTIGIAIVDHALLGLFQR